MTMLAMCSLALTCQGQVNRMYIEDFEIEPDSTVTVPLMLANESESRGLQYSLELPEGLELEEYELSRHSKRYGMHLTCRKVGERTYGAFVYPMELVCYPAATSPIVMLTFTAGHDFKGGQILLRNGRGSTMDNQTFVIDCGTATVTVPAAALVGIPTDQKAGEDQFFH